MTRPWMDRAKENEVRGLTAFRAKKGDRHDPPITESWAVYFLRLAYWPVDARAANWPGMGEHSAQTTADRARSARKQARKQAPDAMGLRLLEIIVYGQNCRIGGHVSVDDLEATEIGDWSMPAFKAACGYAASQGWLIVRDDGLTLTTAGLAAA
jgi:hypothetical protein